MNEITISFAGVTATIDKPVLFSFLSRAARELHKQKMIAVGIWDLDSNVDRVDFMVSVILAEAETDFYYAEEIEKELPKDITYDYLQRAVTKYIKSVLEPIFNQGKA